MMPLFEKGLLVLESLSFTKTLYAFDYDGTLSKIVRDPAEARMSPTTESLLQQLAKLAPVAIVSGRSIDDLKKLLNFEPQYLIGNHGMEGLGHTKSSLQEAHDVCRKWKAILDDITFEPGVQIEDKAYSLSIHYRRSRNRTRSRIQIKDVIEKLKPSPRVIMGKLVANLLPSDAPHKGAAILDLMRRTGLRHTVYVGDDDTDEDVFNLPYNLGQMLTVRVGNKKTSHALYFINRQSEINRMLRFLIRYHRPDNKFRV